ncbi:MAG: sulfatase-like hydrolase/transferase [Rubrobacteraceae bacterium]
MEGEERNMAEQQPSRRDFLRGLTAAGLGAALGSGVIFSRESGAEPPPNVVYISIDDLSWTEFGCYGNTFNETPNIDRLARRGLRFTDAYSGAAICSPARSSLVTGLYPARTGITDYLRPEVAPSDKFLSTDFVTLPELLGGSGYTSALIGKWHLTEDYSGEYRERPGNAYDHGFDEVTATETGYIADGDYFHPYFFMPELEGEEGEYLTDRLARETADFITANKDRPFFVHLSNYAVHTVLDAKPELVAKYQNKPGAGVTENNPELAAMLESVDQQVGAIVARLEELGLAENTLVMVTSDNGGDPAVTSNAPLRGHKSQLYEGGIRVPLIAYWPGGIEPGNISRSPVSNVDVFPTVLELAGIRAQPENALDGESLVPIFRQTGELQRETLYWVYPHFHFLQAIPQAAVRSGQYKLIKFLKDGRTELYNLRKDIGETRDLAQAMPQKAAQLRKMLDAHIEETGVLPPEPTAENYPTVEFADGFEADKGAYTVLTRPSGSEAGEVRYEDGALDVSGDSLFFNLFKTDVSPGSAAAAVTVETRAFAGERGAGGAQDTLFVGLIKDENNYVLLRHHNGLTTSGWDAVLNGEFVTRRGAEPLFPLDGEVDLSAPGSRYSFVLEDTTFTAFSNEGEGWEFLFRVDVGGVLDLSDPAVRSQYKYGFGVRLDSGTMSLESVEARRRD